MKILFCNKYFYPRGGAEIVMFETARLLVEHNHQVAFFSMHHPLNLPSEYSPFFVSTVDFNNLSSFPYKIKAAGRVFYSLEARKKLKALIEREKPDLVHLHNIYHQISPSIIDEIKRWDIPLVMTAHDHKLVCPTYTCLLNGKECALCSRGRYYRCLWHRCTKGSVGMSLVNTLEMYLHHLILHIYEKIDVFISPSLYLKTKLEEMGFSGKIVWLPNFIRVEEFQPAYGSEENSIVYFGRLSREKGLATLIEAVKGLPVNLKIIGDGPQREELESQVRSASMNNVYFLGYLQRKRLHEEIRKSRLVVLPSECPENNPLAVIESFALGKPVLGARIGGIPELVRENETGLIFEPGNAQDLKEKLLFLLSRPELGRKIGKYARKMIEQEFDPDKYYFQLIDIYQKVINK